jgi:hypothetical protein
LTQRCTLAKNHACDDDGGDDGVDLVTDRRILDML